MITEKSNSTLFKEQLIEYLRSTTFFRNADDSKVQKIVDAIEFDLLEVIQSNLNDNLHVVYDFIDKEALEKLFNENANVINGTVIEELAKLGISHKKGEEYLLASEIIKRSY